MRVVDVNLNQLKNLSKATGSVLLYDAPTEVTLYWVNQGPVVFRTVLIKDAEDRFLLGMQHLPPSTLILTPIENPEDVGPLLKEIKEEIALLKRL